MKTKNSFEKNFPKLKTKLKGDKALKSWINSYGKKSSVKSLKKLGVL